MIKEDIKIRFLVYIGLLVGLVFTLFPVFWIFISSVKTNTEVFAYPPSFIPENFTLSAYFNIFNDEDKLRFFFNSYFIAIMVTILTLLISILSGYSFSRFDFKLKRILNLSIISTQTIPPITLLIPYFGIVVTFKIFDTYLALILTYLVFTIPYATLMMTSYFNTLPKELDDAVLMDGGSNFTALCRVIIPISLPGIVATCVYTFLLCWNEFLFALTLTKARISALWRCRAMSAMSTIWRSQMRWVPRRHCESRWRCRKAPDRYPQALGGY